MGVEDYPLQPIFKVLGLCLFF